MEKVTVEMLSSTILVILAVAGAIGVIGKAVDVIKGLRSPSSTLKDRVDRHDALFMNDKKHLEKLDAGFIELKEGQNVTLTCLKTLLDLAAQTADSEGVREVKSAGKEIDDFLLKR